MKFLHIGRCLVTLTFVVLSFNSLKGVGEVLNQNNDEANIANNQEPDQAHRPQGDCAECSSSAEGNASFERDEYADHGAAIVHGEALAADFIARNDYLERAQAAAEAGDRELAMHLFLTAYEEACKRSPVANDSAIAALRRAWGIACDMKERSLAEYIFDKLEPHLSTDEAPEYAKRLQNLALDKLSEFGISRADLEGVADMISEEIGQNAHITGISPIMSMHIPGDTGADSADDSDEPRPTTASADVHKAAPSKAVPMLRYSDLVGFDSIIEDARSLGLGVEDDEEYRALVDTLREQHGLDGLSAVGSVVFRTSSREDANTFMQAVVGELGLPAMRIQMQQGPMGVPMLCVTVSAKNQPRMLGRVALEAPSVLVLEDIDMWGAPLIDAASSTEGEGAMFASMSRAAREAVALVTAAVENPNIYVLASVGGEAPDQGYLYDLMEPMSVVDIYLPDELERRQIWETIASEHPSVRSLDMAMLTKMSRNLSRTDIVTAAREAVEDAYRAGLKARCYKPITQELMFEHISNFQPLDSTEYRALEDAVIADFRKQIADIECDFEEEAEAESRRYDALGDDDESVE